MRNAPPLIHKMRDPMLRKDPPHRILIVGIELETAVAAVVDDNLDAHAGLPSRQLQVKSLLDRPDQKETVNVGEAPNGRRRRIAPPYSEVMPTMRGRP